MASEITENFFFIMIALITYSDTNYFWLGVNSLKKFSKNDQKGINSRIPLKKLCEKFNHCNDFATNLLNNDFNNDFTQIVLLAVNIYVF